MGRSGYDTTLLPKEVKDKIKQARGLDPMGLQVAAAAAGQTNPAGNGGATASLGSASGSVSAPGRRGTGPAPTK
ncbi:hypothetical protein CSOJ01_15341 [Colletotrichum sojae]|uniref:Uncharacterized protein n=1 Tax=Colletotrichum sojae TaxID=2175907 RepID=A0A8H6IMR8_9PEZI|nr:hypothetical protein CSOJ01_15341 [Colletotrichum sojae]